MPASTVYSSVDLAQNTKAANGRFLGGGCKDLILELEDMLEFIILEYAVCFVVFADDGSLLLHGVPGQVLVVLEVLAAGL